MKLLLAILLFSTLQIPVFNAEDDQWQIPDQSKSITLDDYDRQTIAWLLEIGLKQLELDCKKETWYQDACNALPTLYEAIYLGGSEVVQDHRHVLVKNLLNTLMEKKITHYSVSSVAALLSVEMKLQSLVQYNVDACTRSLPDPLDAASAPFAVLLYRCSTKHFGLLGRKKQQSNAYLNLFRAVASTCLNWKTESRASAFVLKYMRDVDEHPIDKKSSKYDPVFEELGERAETDIDPNLYCCLKGADAIIKAWDARGSGWGNTVTDDGWRIFKEQLSIARTQLYKGWQLDKERPEIPTTMLTLVMAGHQGDTGSAEEWFARSVSHVSNYRPAYYQIVNHLQPRWNGTIDGMREFGLRCLNSKRFDTEIPLFYIEMIKHTEIESPYRGNFIGRQYFYDASPKDHLIELFDGYKDSKYFSGIEDSLTLLKAECFCMCGEWTLANDAFRSIEHPERLNPAALIWGHPIMNDKREIKRLDEELTVMLGPDGEICQKIINDYHKKIINIAGFTSAVEIALPNLKTKEAHQYLLTCAGYLMLGVRYDKNRNGSNVLIYVMQKNYTDKNDSHNQVRDWLVKHGIDIDEPCIYQITALLHATRHGKTSTMQYYIDQGANVHALDKWDQGIYHYAVNGNSAEKILALKDLGIDINAVTSEDKSPLSLALENQYIECIDALLSSGAKAELPNGTSIFDYATEQKKKKVLDWINTIGRQRFQLPALIETTEPENGLDF